MGKSLQTLSAKAPMPAASASEPVTAESLGWQLRAALPPMRLHSVSLCDVKGNVLWLSEGALGPDEHNILMEATDAMLADASQGWYELGMEDGRIAVFLAVRAPQGDLVALAMILAEAKALPDDIVTRIVTPAVRGVMQKVAVFLRPVAPPRPATPPTAAAPAAPAAPPTPVLSIATTASLQIPTAAPAARAPVLPSTSGIFLQADYTSAPTAAPVSTNATSSIARYTSGTMPSLPIADVLPPHAVDEMLTLELEPEGPAPAPVATPSPIAQLSAATAALAQRVAPPPFTTNRSATNTASASGTHKATGFSGSAGTNAGSQGAATPGFGNPAAGSNAAGSGSQGSGVSGYGSPAGGTNFAGASSLAGSPGSAVPAYGSPAGSNSSGSASLAGSQGAGVSGYGSAAGGANFAGATSLAGSPGSTAPAYGSPAGSSNSPGSTSLAGSQGAGASGYASSAGGINFAGSTSPAGSQGSGSTGITGSTGTTGSHSQVRGTTGAASTGTTGLNSMVSAAKPANGAPTSAPATSPIAPPSYDLPAATASELQILQLLKLRAGGRTRRFEVSAREAAKQEWQILQCVATWLAENRAALESEPATFSLPVSLGIMADQSFPQRLAALCKSANVPAATFGFEITESMYVQNLQLVDAFVEQCEKLGCFLVIDDLSFDSRAFPLLRSKALRLVKIDPSITTAAIKDKLSQALVVAVSQAAKVLGIHCVAKRVESQAALKWLAGIGCDLAQAPALEKPVGLETLATASKAAK